jgi:hypothetical protein
MILRGFFRESDVFVREKEAGVSLRTYLDKIKA